MSSVREREEGREEWAESEVWHGGGKTRGGKAYMEATGGTTWVFVQKLELAQQWGEASEGIWGWAPAR